MLKVSALTAGFLLLAGAAFLWQDDALRSDATKRILALGGRVGAVSTVESPSKYITTQIETGEIVRTVTATGALNAIVNVEVGSQLSGQIDKVFVDFNDSVRKGQPLAELDQRSFKARLAEAEAGARMAEASVEIQKARL